MGRRGENTGPVQRRFNLRKSREKLEGLLAANFRDGAQLVTLTYGPETRAPSVKLADLQLLDWLRKVQRMRGYKIPYIRATEWAGDGHGYHVHRVVLGLPAASVGALAPLWSYGRVTVQKVQENELEALAGLIMAQAIKAERVLIPARRVWSPSEGLIRPGKENIDELYYTR